MNRMSNVLGLAGVVVMSAGLVACGPSKPRMWQGTLGTSADASLRDAGGATMAQLQVDLVDISPTDKDLASYPVDSWFAGGNEKRQGAQSYTKAFVFTEPGVMTIEANDPIWKAWKDRGVTQLLILASHKNIKYVAGSESRSKLIPMTTDRWKVKRIDVVVKSGGIEVPTAMEPLPVTQ